MAKFGNLVRAADTDRKVLNLYDDYLHHRDHYLEAVMILGIVDKSKGRDRVGTWSASSSGSCLRQQQFTFLGMPKQQVGPDNQNIFFNGDYVHLRYQVAGLIGGWLQEAEVPVVYKTIRGTMDGRLAWDEILEVKSINSRGFDSVMEFGPKAEHKRQVTAYMLATGLRQARFIYENKNTNVNAEFVFDFDPVIAEQVEEEWDRLNSLAAKRELAPMLPDCVQKKGFHYNYCPFTQICKGASWPKSPLKITRSGSALFESPRLRIPGMSNSVGVSPK